MLPDLLTYAPTVTAEFHLSLAEDLITSLRLLRAVQNFEGLSEWVYQTAAALPDDFRSELDILGYPIKCCFQRQDSLIWCLPSDHPAHADMNAFRTYLETVPATEFQRVLLLNLSRDAGELDPPAASDGIRLSHMLAMVRERELEKWSQTFLAAEEDAPLITLIQTPEQLKARLYGLLTRFWDEYYCQDFETQREPMIQSVAYHRRQVYRRNFPDLFRQVTGRRLPPAIRDYVQEHLEKIERVIFCPCAHLGLYFQITLSYPTLVVAFNYRTTPAQAREGTAAVELFPPLKALADETRLHILSLLQKREMYAQEIVSAVGLSQSTISRHLQLLERTEVVNSRQVRGLKFYSINRGRGRAILDPLRRLIG
jgi:DNA-binding transcriptional ArsR family regulator